MKTLVRVKKIFAGLLFAGFTLFLNNPYANADTVNSVASGNWNDDATWDGSAPRSGDTAHIQPGHTVSVVSSDDVSLVTINADDMDAALLDIKSGVTLTVTDRVFINSTDFNNAEISVTGILDAQGLIEYNASMYFAFSRINVNGTLKIGGTISSNSSSYFVDSRNGTVEYNSTSAQSIYKFNYNYGGLILSGGSTKTLSDNTSVNNNLSISSSTLDVTANNYSLTVGGNWVNSSGTFTARSGTVTLNGSGSQAITSNANDFYNLTINNTGSGISLNDNVTVTNNCTLTDGVVSTGSNTFTLESTSASSLSGYSNGSFINGNLRRYIASNTSTYAFPVGNGTSTTNYFRADVVNSNMVGVSYIDASFGSLTNHSDGDMSVDDSWIYYNSVHTSGMWTIEPSSQPSGGQYDIRLYIANVSGLSDNSFAPLKRPAGGDGSNWTAPGTLSGDGGEGRMASENYAVRFGLTSFSEFGVGTGTPTGLGLPIELLEFTGKKSGSSVVLEWITESEINNDFYTLERSLDGNTFTSIATINGAGNSLEKHNYQYYDNDPADGINYYRLKQTDFDGTFTYSDVVSVEFTNPENNFFARIYPNPVNPGNAVRINFSNSFKGVSNIQIYSAGSGKLVYNQKLSNENYKFDIPQNLSAGLYFVKINTEDWEYSQKLVVQ